VQGLREANWTHLLGEFGHIDGLDSLEGRQPLQTLSGLLLHCDNESILDIAVLREVQR
jgi:hypothetical protein